MGEIKVWFKPEVPAPYGYRDLLTYTVQSWEGGYQAWGADRGNYLDGELIGTNRGITPAALMDWTGRKPTVQDMKALTVEQAVDIMLPRYYDSPDLDVVPWCRPVAVILDHALNAGPNPSIKIIQRIVGAKDDGWMGPKTSDAIRVWMGRVSPTDQLDAIADARIAFYKAISKINPKLNAFLVGWTNRADDFRSTGRWIRTLPANFPFG